MMLIFWNYKMPLNFLVLAKIRDFFRDEEPDIKIVSELKVPKKEIKKRKTYSISDNRKVWEDIFGKEYEVVCKICKRNKMSALDKNSWHMAHINSFSEGGADDLENIRPVCADCNKSMSACNLVEYCKKRYPLRFELILEELKIKES